MNSVWEGHQFGKWYPWPQQVPIKDGYYIARNGIGTSFPAKFTRNKAGNGGKWKFAWGTICNSSTLRHWMPLPKGIDDAPEITANKQEAINE